MFLIPFAAIAVILLAHCVRNVFFHRLSRYPGPRLATLTDVWRLWDIASGMRQVPRVVALHKRHRNVVRVGPNHLSFTQPEAIRDIYGIDKPFRKSLLYWAAAPVTNGRVNQTLFSSNDVEWHNSLRSAIQSSFKTSAIAQYEPAVDAVIDTFIEQLRQRFVGKSGPSGIVDLPQWLQYFAFDVLGQVTYSSDFGALQKGSDIHGMMAATHKLQTYTVVAGSMPLLDHLLAKNPLLMWLNRRGLCKTQPNAIVTWAVKWLRQRESERGAEVEENRSNLFHNFLQAKERSAGKLTDAHCISLGISMIVAGSESTAISTTAALYFLLKKPASYRRLQDEIDRALESAAMDNNKPVPWKVARALPYLDACVRETFRLHPAGRFSLERIVPSQGATIAGHDIPGGTIVGIHPWAMHRNPDVFGEDVEDFRPERWLPAEDCDTAMEEQRIARMNGALMHFGQGRFSCLGKDISLMEMYKVIPSLMRRFSFSLLDPAQEWRFEPGGFVNVSGVDVVLEERDVQT